MKEEPVDILDEQGNKTGQTMLKSQAHKQGLWHGGAHIWIYNSKGEVLLQLRSPKKIVKPNVWDVSVAGHIPAGKTPLETVVEEAQEELGLKVEPKDLVYIGKVIFDDLMPPDNWQHRVHTEVYALLQDGLKLSDLNLEEAEISDARWISLGQFSKDLNDPSKDNQYSRNRVSYNLAMAKIPKLLEAKA
jgi:isopentenyldiphosphate isomerase